MGKNIKLNGTYHTPVKTKKEEPGTYTEDTKTGVYILTGQIKIALYTDLAGYPAFIKKKYINL